MDDSLDTLKKFQRTYHQYVKADEKMCASKKDKRRLDNMTAENYWWDESTDNHALELNQSLKKARTNLSLAEDDLRETTAGFGKSKANIASIEEKFFERRRLLIDLRKKRLKNSSMSLSVVLFVIVGIIIVVMTPNMLIIMGGSMGISMAMYFISEFIIDTIQDTNYTSCETLAKTLYEQYRNAYPSSSYANECTEFMTKNATAFFAIKDGTPMESIVAAAAKTQASIRRSKEIIEARASSSAAQAKQLIAACTEAKQQAEERMNAAFRERGEDLLNAARSEATAAYEQDRATCLELRKQLRGYNAIPSEKDWSNVDLIVDFIQSGRASTLAEALKLCDELSHRESLRQAEAKRLRDQERFHEEQRIRMAELEEEQAREAARNEARHQERLVQEQLNHEEMLRVQEQTRNAQIAAAAAQAAALLQNRQANKNR